MKNLFFIILFFTAFESSACTCAIRVLSQRYDDSEFVGEVRIISQSLEVKDSIRWKVFNVEVLENYKGTSPIVIYSRDEGCGFYAANNSKWLIFTNKDLSNYNLTNYCSGNIEFNPLRYVQESEEFREKMSKRLETKLNVLKMLKVNKIKKINETNLYFGAGISADPSLKGFSESTKFSMYSVTIGTNLKVKKIVPIKKFKNIKLKKSLEHYIENYKFNYSDKVSKPLVEDKKIILIFYYYPAEKEFESFVSINDL